MNEVTKRELLRYATGRLPAGRAREIEARLERDEDLALAYRRLSGAWRALELPPPEPAPPGFAARVVAHAGSAGPQLGSAPFWVRAAAALALVAGVALGAGVALRAERGGLSPWPDDEAGVPSLADAYRLALEEPLGTALEAPHRAGRAGEPR